ncbi:MAG: hypothetical protein UT03_C0034G0003 [Candidatus Moranbacteria bacterium GW2011_GWD2_38_7]|nr:MAG: hypothetical protein UT03_C0034G0003 [Candidatus Moranbacteria bacterium GW2011_GWD2_38_7]
MQKITALFSQTENVISLFISFFLSVNIALLANRKSEFSIFADTQNPDVFYAIFLFLIAIMASFFFFPKKISTPAIIKKLILIFLPFELTLITCLYFWKPELNVLFFLFAVIYAFIASFLIIKHAGLGNDKTTKGNQTTKQWVAKQGKVPLILLFSIMIISGSFGSYRISQFSAVDEPLWTFDRIPSFWKNVREMNWKNTNISDKPGITVALISGVGLLDVNPKLYDSKVDGSKNRSSEKMNYAFRLPLLLFAIFSLPLFYFLLERLIGKRSSLLAVSLIGLSPILLGMSRIINPDALLWIFAPMSVLSFLTYQKRRHVNYLYLTGVFLGLAILTKYVANIVYIFLFGMIFLEYIFNHSRYGDITFRKYIISAIKDFLILVILSLATFYILYPGTWLKPQRILTGTILSQAFVSTWPVFAAFFSLLIADVIFFKNNIFNIIVRFASKQKDLIAYLLGAVFLLIIVFIFYNVYLDMKIYNFQEILASPKTSFKENGFLGLFLSNFYPLIFAISPIAIFGTIIVLTKIIFRYKKEINTEKLNITLFLTFFIFLYYIGTTVNNVVSTSRYQIMLYPLILIISSLGLVYIYEKIEKKYTLKKSFFTFFAALIIIISTFSLADSKPFYLSYASFLLPNENYLDLKDMGPGSYEVAEYLNSLPNSEKLTIWTDKKGVCTFFKGSCYGDLSYDELEGVSFDYIAVSWGRKSRTTNMVRSQSKLATNKILNFAQYYDQEENIAYKLLINDRPAQYVKVIKVNK